MSLRYRRLVAVLNGMIEARFMSFEGLYFGIDDLIMCRVIRVFNWSTGCLTKTAAGIDMNSAIRMKL